MNRQIERQIARLRALTKDPRTPILAAVALIALVAFVLTDDGGERGVVPEPEGFSISPQGEGAPRLGPIRVTFEKPPAEHDGARILTLTPPVEGEYVWASDRTLLFQPAFPGLLRGWAYTVTVTAQPAAGLASPVKASFVTEGLLTVDAVLPAAGDVEVPAQAQVLVQFSRSVAPLTLLSEQTAAGVVEWAPPLAGKGEWLNTSLYRFVPDRFEPNTRYRGHIRAGLTSAADGVLKEDFTWEFTTYGPALASISPDANTMFVGPVQPVVLVFNQPMDRASVEAGFRLEDSAGSRVAGAFTWASGDVTATFTPASPYAPLGRYTVMLAKGLRGASGGETKEPRQVGFTGVGPPRVASTRPGSGETAAERYGFQVEFTNPMDVVSFEGRVSISGIADEDLQLYPDFDGRRIYGAVSLKPSTDYTVSIAAGVVDRYGQPLPAYSFSFRTGQLPRSVSFAIPNQIATFSSTTDPVLYFHTTNTTAVLFALHPLTDAEAATLQRQNYIETSGPRAFVPSQPAVRRWSVAITDRPDEVVLNSTSLGGGAPLPKGHYFITTDPGDWNAVLAFSVVDVAIVVKVSQDELLAWVVDLATGTPLESVTAHAEGDSLSSAGDRTTGTGGLVSWPVTRSYDPSSSKDPFQDPFLVTVSSGGRLGVASTAWVQGASPWQLGIPYSTFAPQYVGHVYTDRPIYRPGEDVHFKAVIRLDDDAAYSLPVATPDLTLIVRSPDGKELVKAGVNSKELVHTGLVLGEFGTFASSLSLPADATIGDYFVVITQRVGANELHVASTSFLVAEFRKPEFQVEVATDAARYADGDTIAVTASATFFFGGPLANAPVAWTVTSSPYAFRPPEFDGYSFSDYDFFRTAVTNTVIRASGTGQTGSDGAASFSVAAALIGNEGAREFQVSATVTDENAQAVAASQRVAVHPGALYAGVRAEDYVVSAGQDAAIALATVDLDGKSVPQRAVVVKVYERAWVTTKELTAGGGRRYRSEPLDTLVATIPATTGADGKGAVTYRPAHPGTLRIVAEATDASGRTARSATYLWVASAEFASWRVTNDDLIELVADRDRYEVGDTAEVLVPAPFSGARGLVTVERGKILSLEVRTFPTNSERLSIPIVASSVPNVYVSVVLYRAPTAEDPIPRYKVGYVELPVSTASRTLHVDIQPDRTQAKPGDTVRYEIRVTDQKGRGVKSELSVAVVDKAVLSLADERGPDGLQAFWFERPLGVLTSSSLAVSVDRSNDVISEPPQGGKGGGGGDVERIRQDFRNTAYWAAQVATDDSGFATVDVKMPDDLTTWRFQARAVSGDTLVGEGTNELLSTQPLLLRPALPRFLRVGDAARLRLLVRNATQSPTEVTVTLSAEGVVVAGDLSRQLHVEPGESVLTEWPATVEVEGTARLQFTASSTGGERDAVVQELPVALDVTPETTATGGVVKATEGFEAVYLPSYAITRHGALEVSVQPSLVGSLAGELAWFAYDARYWEGTDRIAARVLATIADWRARRSAGQEPSLPPRVTSDVATLVARQAGDGGWAWCSFCASDPRLTAWVLIALGEAARDGAATSWSGSARSFLDSELNRIVDVAHPADASEKALYLYAMAVSGEGGERLPEMRALFEQYRASLSNWGRAYLLMAFAEAAQPRESTQVSGLLNDLTSAVIPSANGNHWEDPYSPGAGHTATRTTALALQALVRVSPGHPLIEETVRWLMVARGTSDWVTDYERAQGIVALDEFATATGELAGDFGYGVKVGGATVLSGRFRAGAQVQRDTTRVALDRLPLGTVSIIAFLREFGSGRLYYTLNLRYVTPARDVEALNRGFAVAHEYTRLDDPSTPITHAALGETIRVKVTVLAPAERYYVVVNDLLPAGFEPVDPQLKIVDPALIQALEAERQALDRPAGADYYAPWWGWYWSPWQQVDIRDDRLTLRASRLPKGVHEYVYYARATTPGDYFVAPAYAEESNFPEVFGRSDSGRFVVDP